MLWLAPWFFIPAITAPTLILIGGLMLKRPPTKPNGIYGYRTRRSRASQEAWDYSQVASSKRLLVGGIAMVVLGLPGLFVTVSEGAGVLLGLGLVMLGTFLPVIQTERELKARFDP